MKRLLILLALGAAASARPASAAELKILAPLNKAVVRGVVEFRIQPVDAPTDQFLENPYVTLQDAAGRVLDEVRAPRNKMTGVCAALVDTTRLRDGVYTATVRYRTLVGGKPVRIEELMSLSVRNQNVRPAKFTVQFEDRAYKSDESADLKVRVLDASGRPMVGARVTFESEEADLESEAELTDVDGEAFITLSNEDGEPATVTIRVEGLPPVKKVFRFQE